ncbi:glycoside hydrolase family 28 protein [Mycena maculata]|uniref:galacturonan 1,4-alpha-galacturonidase n=1 Tax=Mycena maculata TaxID=230809 RepID=A0AAD7NMJ2_9AGAR|nr:glycoside hydrolase family 28 protein [Mycena maculata]
MGFHEDRARVDRGPPCILHIYIYRRSVFRLRQILSFSKMLCLVLSLLALAGLQSAVGRLPPHRPGVDCTVKAAGKGKDDSPTFISAMQACSTVVVPVGTTLNISTRLNTTGLKDTHLSLQGTMRFNPDIPYWSENGFPFTYQNQVTFWILGGKNLLVDGGGTLDGAGQDWYDAFAANASLLRPITLTLFQATNVLVQDIHYLNSPEWFHFVNEGKNVTFNHVTLNAASTSANGASNTDGWDIYRSDQVTIKNSVINNGDDCVSFKVSWAWLMRMVKDTTNTLVTNLNCNGSHGISVGSLGQYPGEFDIVQNVTAINIRMSNAENGARIKAFGGPGVGSGVVQNITFTNFIESAVESPIVIDQCYETTTANCSAFPSNVFISDVSFNFISGTGTSGTVATLDCSPGARCSNITVNNLDLAGPSGTAEYECQNVNLTGNAVSLFGACTST